MASVGLKLFELVNLWKISTDSKTGVHRRFHGADNEDSVIVACNFLTVCQHVKYNRWTSQPLQIQGSVYKLCSICWCSVKKLNEKSNKCEEILVFIYTCGRMFVWKKKEELSSSSEKSSASTPVKSFRSQTEDGKKPAGKKVCFYGLLVCPEVIACGADLSFSPDVLFIFFISFVNARSPRCVGRPAWNFARWSVLGLIL